MAIKYWVEGDKITLSLWSSFMSPIALNFLRAELYPIGLSKHVDNP